MDILIDKIIKYNNPSVIGLDPFLNKLPKCILDKHFSFKQKTLQAAGDAIFEFNRKIIDSIFDIVPCVKPQSAYYELYGFYGVKALYDTINYAKSKGMYVILDGKRNDIGPTMSAYSSAYIGTTDVLGESICAFNADSLTINTYLGKDTLNALQNDLVKYKKTVFNLVKTSNPSSSDLQDKILLHQKVSVSTYIGEMCQDFSSDSIGKYNFTNVGAVIGATYPEYIKQFRYKLKNTFFLVPGYGSQGATANDIKYAFNKDGIGAVINASRSIIYAYIENGVDDENFCLCIREAALDMKKDINSYI